jgi:hypothetical protein
MNIAGGYLFCTYTMVQLELNPQVSISSHVQPSNYTYY